MICTNCHTIGKPINYTPGSFLVECALWLLFIVPGVLYSLWRISARKKVCAECRAPNMISEQSNRGQRIIATEHRAHHG